VEKGKDLVVVVIVPARGYAAALIALGILIGKFSGPHDTQLGAVNIEEKLRKLNKGSPVVIQEGNKQTNGDFSGISKKFNDNNLRVGVHIPNKKTEQITRWLLLDQCIVNILPSGTISIIPNLTNEYSIIKHQDFTNNIAPEINMKDIVATANIECLFVTQISMLRSEIVDMQFASTNMRIQETTILLPQEPSDFTNLTYGNLQDILRVRKFLKRDFNFLTDILPVDSKRMSDQLDLDKDTIVLFDGSSALLKWDRIASGAVKIIVLDRTDTRFEEAIELVNTKYVDRQSDVNVIPEAPNNIETIVFY